MLCLKLKSTDQSTLQNLKCRHKEQGRGEPTAFQTFFFWSYYRNLLANVLPKEWVLLRFSLGKIFSKLNQVNCTTIIQNKIPSKNDYPNFILTVNKTGRKEKDNAVSLTHCPWGTITNIVLYSEGCIFPFCENALRKLKIGQQSKQQNYDVWEFFSQQGQSSLIRTVTVN